ncbi:MAG: DUF4340 domain-containing protein [Saprospiraceae bacterium]|nr:DUF4340 domain-containing protein [Saprospiraceae bacterium]
MPEISNFYWYGILICLTWGCKPGQGDQMETDFKLSNPERIAAIEIYHQGILEQTLSKTKQGWIVNQKYAVRPDAIDNILRILPDLRVMYFPPSAAWENMVRAIKEQGVTLVFKGPSGQKIKSFSLGGTTNDERGTYAMMEGSTKPYVIHVPGFDGSLANRFIMEENDWRDRMIFKEIKEDLIKIKVNYPEQPGAGFELEKVEGKWRLFSLSRKPVTADESLIHTYLDGFSGIGAEGIENDFKSIPQVLEMTPHAVIEIQKPGRTARIIKFYPIRLDGQDRVERFYVYDGKDFFLAQMRILQKLFRSIDSF